MHGFSLIYAGTDFVIAQHFAEVRVESLTSTVLSFQILMQTTKHFERLEDSEVLQLASESMTVSILAKKTMVSLFISKRKPIGPHHE